MDLIKNIMKFNRKDYYQNKNELTNNAVRRYVNAKKNEKISTDELSGIKNESEEILLNIMTENGFRDENAYISLDKEFFTEGQFDNDKLEKFKKNMMLHYAEQQLKWTFAGTSSLYSPITKRYMRERDENYSELLPSELKKKYLQEGIKKHIHNKNADFRLFLYADGTTSDKYIPEKACFSFDKLKDCSGFDWTTGYSPENVIKKKDWIAGFNEIDEWNKFMLDEEFPVVDAANPADPSVFFTDRFEEGENYIGFLSTPNSDEVFLFDNTSLLKEDREERYYSITGELYGVRGVDREGSIEFLKKYLKKNKINRLAGIVAGDCANHTKEYYKNIFSDFVTEQTVFYSSGDVELKNKLKSMKEEVEGNEISAELISNFFALTERGIRGGELYDGLIPAIQKKEYEINLNIFDSEENLDTFLMIPEIKKGLGQDVIGFLKSVDVPEEKKGAYSNSVQNILRNYDSLFKYSNMEKKDMLQASYDVVVKNNSGSVKDIRIIREKNLADFIKENSRVLKKSDIPSFSRAFKSGKDYFNISDKKELNKWASSELKRQCISNAAIVEALEIISNADVPADKTLDYSRAVQNTFAEFSSISMSTGMRPSELAGVIEDVIVNDKTEMRYERKRIYFDKDMESLLYESAEDNPNKAIIIKEDIYLTKKIYPLNRELDLLNDADLNTFALSPLMKDAGLSDLEADEVIDYLKTVTIPSHKACDFSRGVHWIFKSLSNDIARYGFTPIEAVRYIENAVNGEHEKIPDKIENIIYTAIGKKKVLAYPLPHILKDKHAEAPLISADEVEFDLSNENDLRSFALSPLMKESGINAEECEKIVNYLKEASIPPDKTADFTRGVAHVLRTYNKHLAPSGIAPIDAVKSVVYSVNGYVTDSPEIINKFIPRVINNRIKNNPFQSVDSLNLLDGNDLDTFVRSPLFRYSGIKEEQLHDLISHHRESYSGMQNRYYRRIPVRFKSLEPDAEDMIVPTIAQLAVNLKPPEIENNIYNTGWVVTRRGNDLKSIRFTDFGKKKLNPITRQRVLRTKRNIPVTQRPDSPALSSTSEKTQSFELTSEAIIDAPGKNDPYPREANEAPSSLHRDDFIFTVPLVSPEKKNDAAEGAAGLQTVTGDAFYQKTPGIINSKSPRHIQPEQPMLPEDARMKKIEQNYDEDTRRLAKSDSWAGSSAFSREGKSGDEGNKVRKVLDELLEEFVQKVEGNIE